MNVLLAVILASTSFFHTALKTASPARDAILAQSPAKVTLTFTEKIRVPLSAIAILKPDSTEVMKLKVHSTSDAAVVEGDVLTPLAPGKYIVRWRTSAADGHAARGAYAFTIKPTK